MLKQGIALTLWVLCGFLSSCEKAEFPISLPPQGSAQVARVDMGPYYEDQIFFCFESSEPVMTSKVEEWDLAFESDAQGFHVFLNGGKNIFIYPTGSSDISRVSQPPQISESDWKFDSPTGLKDSTAVGDWRNNPGQVYILKFNNNIYKKLILLAVSGTGYLVQYGDLTQFPLNTITIPKNPLFNYAYFSFDQGGQIVTPDPPKENWDIVFTRYRHIYYDLNNFPYLVSGVLLNPYKTAALPDSSDAFSNIEYSPGLAAKPFSNLRDIIGFDWKKYNFSTGMFEVNSYKTFVVRTRKDQYWKLHFLDFYSPAGVKGSPTFEYERIY